VIAVERDENGRPVEYTPHERYARAAIATSTDMAWARFTKLTIAQLPTTPGVYAIEPGTLASRCGSVSKWLVQVILHSSCNQQSAATEENEP